MKRALAPHVINAAAWYQVVAFPFPQLHGASLIALALVHLLAPLWSTWVDSSGKVHHRFARGPFAVFVVDVVALVIAFKRDSFGEQTHLVVAGLFMASLVVLVYAAGLMTLLGRRAEK